MMGATTRLALTGGTGDADGVDGFATVNSDSTQVAVLVYNFYKSLAGQTAIDDINFSISNLPLRQGQVEVSHYRVDETHSNAYGVWLKQGKPALPSTTQWSDMRAAAELAEIRPATTSTIPVPLILNHLLFHSRAYLYCCLRAIRQSTSHRRGWTHSC